MQVFLKKRGDSIDLLGKDVKGYPRHTIEEICNSASLYDLLTRVPAPLVLFDENGNQLSGDNILKAINVSTLLESGDVSGLSGFSGYVNTSNPIYKTIANDGDVISEGDLIFADTRNGSFSLILPATPRNAGNIEIVDIGYTCSTNPLTLYRNGNTINKKTENFILDVSQDHISLLFNDIFNNWDLTILGTFRLSGENGSLTSVEKTVLNNGETINPNTFVFLDTAGGSFSMLLPANPANGDIVEIADSGDFCGTNSFTINRNGKKINSLAEDFVLDENLANIRLVFNVSVDSWDVVFLGIYNFEEEQD
jgi:hypothetical protein